MKPVEIEFLMRDKLSGGIDNARMKADLLDASLKRIAFTIGGVFTVDKALEFGKVMMDVRGQIESFQISFETLLGSKDKANAFFGEIKDFAVETPLLLDGLSNAAQMMLGFGIDSEKVIPTLKQIGDITMGNAQKFDSMTLAFSQMSATGKLMGQDLLQMINVGFNPLTVMSARTGKSVAQLKDEMSEGAISAEMVAQAFADATAEGGRFHNMLEKQSKGVNGMKSNFEGAVDDALNDFGSKSQSLYVDGLEMATSLVKNYDEVGKILISCITIYGSYKAAVLAVTTVEKLRYQATLAQMAGMTKMQAVTSILKDKTAALNATMLANPCVLVTASVIALIAATAIYSKSCSSLKDEVERLNTREKDQSELLSDRKSKIEELISAIEDENTTSQEKQEKLNELKSLMPSVFNQYKTEKELIDHLTEAKKAYNNELREEKNLKGLTNLKEDNQRLKDYQRLKELFDKGTQTISGTDEYREYAALQQKYRDEINKSKGSFQTFGDFYQQQIKTLIGTVAKDTNIIRENEQNKWQASVNSMNQTTANEMISYYNKVLKIANDSGKKWVQLQGDTTPINTSELKKRIQSLTARSKYVHENASKDYLNDAKAAWEKAQKEVKDIINGRGNRDLYPDESAYQTALAKAKEKEAAGKKTYEKSGGQTKNKTPKGLTETEKANQLKVEKDARERQIAEYTQSLVEQERQSEFDIRRSKNEGIKESTEKEKETIALSYDQLIEENRKRKEKWIKELQEKVNLEFENKNPDYKKKGLLSPVVTEADLSLEQKKQLEDYTSSANSYRKSSEDKLLKELLQKYNNYEQQRAEINQKYNEDRQSIENWKTENGKALADDVKEVALAEIEKKRKESLKQVNETEIEEMQKSSSLLVDLFADNSQKSVNEIQKIIDKMKLLMTYLATAKNENGDALIKNNSGKVVQAISEKEILDLGFSKSELDTLSQSPEKLKAIQKAVKELKGEVAGKSPFKEFTDSISEGLGKIKLGGDNNLGEGISQIGNAVTKFTPAVKKFGTDLGAIFGNDKIANTIGNITSALGGLGTTANGIGQIMSGDVIGGIMGAVSGISTLVSAMGGLFGGVDKNAQNVSRMLGEVDNMKGIWDDILARQREYLSNSTGQDATKEYEKSLDILKQQEGYYRNIAQETLKVRNGGHSMSHRMWAGSAGFDGQNWRDVAGQIKELTGVTVGSMDDIANMSAEDLEILQENFVGLWSNMDGTFRQQLENIIKNEQEIGNLKKAYQEALSGTTYDTVRSDFMNELSDMKSSSKDFADNLEGYLRNAILNAMMYENYNKEIQEWYDKFASENAREGGITDDAYKNLQKEWNDIVSSALSDRDALRDKFGWGSDDETSQSGKSGSFNAMSQEKGTKLEGLFTALQIHVSKIDTNVESLTTAIGLALDKLSNIERNTEYCKHLEQIAQDITMIKRDGLAMK